MLSKTVDTFDEIFDVIVVGYGFGGAVAAINAHDAGAKVLLAEKMPNPGGISICSGGGLRLPHDRDATFAYLKATNDGTCLLYTSPSPRDKRQSRMPSSA